jgi:hypothetical protein
MFISETRTDFGLAEFNDMNAAERVRRYRRYVYEAGALSPSGKEFVGSIDPGVVEKERHAGFRRYFSKELPF